MLHKKNSYIFLIFLLALFALFQITACTDSSSDGSSEEAPPSDDGSSAGEARTNCGVVIDNSLKNPVSVADGIPVRIESVADSNALIVVNATGGRFIVKLHGVSNEPLGLKESAISHLGTFVGSTVLYVSAGDNCPATVSGGGQGQLGQLITNSGVSIAESLIRTSFATSTASDACGSSLVSSCFTALAQSAPLVAGELSAFLWKPIAESDGNLAIHTGPFGSTVIVNGEVGRNQGPGNGFGSLARFSKPGCAYGNNSITVRDTRGYVYTVGGQASFNVPNPCGRHCLQNGQIVACSK
jgi:hypothetical protein